MKALLVRDSDHGQLNDSGRLTRYFYSEPLPNFYIHQGDVSAVQSPGLNGFDFEPLASVKVDQFHLISHGRSIARVLA